jgi:condensin complex subunit 3
MNLEVTPQTLPYLIERARDVDAINRRLLYSRPLAEIPDFRMISSEDRYRLIKWGLSDRDAKVRAATGKMIADHWIKQADHNLLEVSAHVVYVA